MKGRPQPPASIFEPGSREFEPAPEIAEWAKTTFIAPAAPLHNPDHEHLADAHIGFLWTTVGLTRHMHAIAGQAEIPRAQGNKWVRGRAIQQLEEWFGEEPDFLITLDANYALRCDDASFCALVEHELYHCGQEKDAYGAPKFNSEGMPVYGIRGHDVEEFVGIVRRYGIGAAAGQSLAFVEAAKRGPEITQAVIKVACGSCRALV